MLLLCLQEAAEVLRRCTDKDVRLKASEARVGALANQLEHSAKENAVLKAESEEKDRQGTKHGC